MSSEKYNPFKHLYQEESLPPEHKESVMQTIEMIKLVSDIAELFSIKQAQTDTDLLANMIKSKRKKKP